MIRALEILISIVVSVAAICPDAMADIPDYLQATFDPELLVADVFSIHPEGGGEISVRTFFDTNEQTVNIHWMLTAPQMTPAGFPVSGEEIEAFATSFKPTAVCREAGLGDAFYVAGVVPRSGAVVVERWTVDEPQITALAPPITDPPQQDPPDAKAVLTKTVRRELVASYTDLSAIKTMAFNPVSQRLVLIDSGVDASSNETQAYELDPQAGARSDLIVLSQLEELRYHHTLLLHVSPQHGLIWILDRRPRWLWLNLPLMAKATKIVLIRDPDLTGGYPIINTNYTYESLASDGFLDDSIVDYTSPWP